MPKLLLALFFGTTSAVLFSERTMYYSHSESVSASAAAKFQRNALYHMGGGDERGSLLGVHARLASSKALARCSLYGQ
jgi:hypothetical protein